MTARRCLWCEKLLDSIWKGPSGRQLRVDGAFGCADAGGPDGSCWSLREHAVTLSDEFGTITQSAAELVTWAALNSRALAVLADGTVSLDVPGRGRIPVIFDALPRQADRASTPAAFTSPGRYVVSTLHVVDAASQEEAEQKALNGETLESTCAASYLEPYDASWLPLPMRAPLAKIRFTHEGAKIDRYAFTHEGRLYVSNGPASFLVRHGGAAQRGSFAEIHSLGVMPDVWRREEAQPAALGRRFVCNGRAVICVGYQVAQQRWIDAAIALYGDSASASREVAPTWWQHRDGFVGLVDPDGVLLAMIIACEGFEDRRRLRAAYVVIAQQMQAAVKGAR
jgi:hypothetical protein